MQGHGNILNPFIIYLSHREFRRQVTWDSSGRRAAAVDPGGGARSKPPAKGPEAGGACSQPPAKGAAAQGRSPRGGERERERERESRQ